MFNRESWKPIYFRVKRSKIKVTTHEAHKQCRRWWLKSTRMVCVCYVI